MLCVRAHSSLRLVANPPLGVHGTPRKLLSSNNMDPALLVHFLLGMNPTLQILVTNVIDRIILDQIINEVLLVGIKIDLAGLEIERNRIPLLLDPKDVLIFSCIFKPHICQGVPENGCFADFSLNDDFC